MGLRENVDGVDLIVRRSGMDFIGLRWISMV